MIGNQSWSEILVKSLRMGRLRLVRVSGHMFDTMGEAHSPEIAWNKLWSIVRDNDARKTEVLKYMGL